MTDSSDLGVLQPATIIYLQWDTVVRDRRRDVILVMVAAHVVETPYLKMQWLRRQVGQKWPQLETGLSPAESAHIGSGSM